MPPSDTDIYGDRFPVGVFAGMPPHQAIEIFDGKTKIDFIDFSRLKN
jgi:hypothetical protein